MRVSWKGGALWPSHADILLGATCCEQEHQRSKPERVDVMTEWKACIMLWTPSIHLPISLFTWFQELLPKLQDAYGIEYDCLTESLIKEQEAYHLQGAIEDILDDDNAVDLEDDMEEQGFEIMDQERSKDATITKSRWTNLRQYHVIGSPCVVASLNLATITTEDLDLLRAKFDFDIGSARIDSITCWFDVHFR